MSESEVKVAPNGANGFATPLFGFPKIELPAVIGELAEQSVARAKQGCERIKIASEEMADTFRETYSSHAKSATDYGLKLLEISNANTSATMDFFADLLGSKSATDVVTLTAAQSRKVFDAASAQNRELWKLAEKLTMETSEPIKKHFAKALEKAG